MSTSAANKRRQIAVITNTGHVVGKSVLDKFALKSDEQSRAIPSDRFEGAYGQAGLVQPLYNPETLATLLEVNTWHARCVRTKANDVAGLGWGLSPLVENPSDEERRVFYEFAKARRLGQALIDVLVDAWHDFEATGDCYFEVVRENYDPEGKPVIFKRLPAHTVRAHKDGARYAQRYGALQVWFKTFGHPKDVSHKTGAEAALGSLPPQERATEIIHLKNYNARSDFYGLPDVLPAIGAIEAIRSARDYNIEFFDNYGVPAYAVYITGDYDLGDPDENGEYPVIKDLEKHLKNIADNPHTPLVMAVPSASPTGTVKVEFEKLSVETKDSHFRMYRKDSRDEILCAHGVPAYRVGLVETGSLGGNTADASDKIYRESVLAPRKRKLEQVFNLYILPALEIESWKFYLEDLDISDEKHDMEVAGFLFDKGAITPNQLIRYFGDRFGIEPDQDEPAMDWHYIGGKPVEAEAAAQTESVSQAENIVKSLHDRLVNIAIKEEAKNDDAA